MATKHDEFKVYYFSFTDDELKTIIDALNMDGKDDLADEIWREAYGDEPASIASLTFDIDTTGVKDATEELGKLEKAANSLADAYERLHDAMSGPVEYNGAIDAVDRLINELMSGAK